MIYGLMIILKNTLIIILLISIIKNFIMYIRQENKNIILKIKTKYQ